MKDNQTVLTPPESQGARVAKENGAKTFAFDRSYWSFNKDDASYAGQSNLFDDLGKPLLDNAFQGYNNCIFAYGQTGSGKSYSMMGYGKEIGIIPNICQEMFRRIQSIQDRDPTTKCTVEVSYLEIYNERVRDLLNPATKGNLKVREHPSTGPYVEDLAKLVVGTFQEIENLMDEGNKARTVAATNMNETSSRSHAVFTLMLTQKKYDAETKMEMEKVAKISLVDLAGSERATSTGATGARLKEGAEINRSLSTLGRVIAALADLSTGKKKKGAGQVPYRDSVLTWLLKDSLGGNSMTAMIAAISPADINYDETLSTLRYADSAKRIKNHAVINEDANARMIRELKEELALLRSKLGGGGSATAGGGAVHPEEVYADGTPLEKQMVTITAQDGTVQRVSKAEIAEQLSQSEKLLTDLNQTWEQKLQKTEEIHKERESALEELGISIEKGFIGLHTPKKMPHLVNLSDDPLLAECLVYNLKPGTTTVGNVDTNADHQANIRLNGTRILHDHCTFENAADGTVTVIPREGTSVMVNGKRIAGPKQLHSGYRVILGDFHIFRFNHPMEARAERGEAGQSLLRQSLTAAQIQALDRTSPCPSPRPGHDRSTSKTSDYGEPRPESPSPFLRRDSDWSLARREAARAILGTDQNFASLTDEELNALFEDVQRARVERVNVREDGEDSESVTSYQLREKYMSTGTIDNFSLDTALTMPSTPKQGEAEDRLKEAREEMQNQLDRQKEEFQEQLKSAEASNVEVEEIRREKAKMETALQELKDMQKQLLLQRKQFEDKIERMDPLKRPRPSPILSEEDVERAKSVLGVWRGRHFVKMAESALQNAAMLKEAQIMSNELNENVVFQFTVVDVGHALCSSYDMVLNGLTGEGEDVALEEAEKPCIWVRVMDYKNSVVHLWSVEKLHDRVRQMRQMHQYLDQPEYAQHLSLENPFVEPCMPSYTLVGEADVPLKAVFESRVQDFSLDVHSPYTSHAVGIIKLSLEPSHARAPTNTLKFNVVIRELVGFAEREGTEVHAQLFIPGVSEDDGVTTQMIQDFDEGPIRFESVHNMSVPLFASQDVTLRVAIFAHVSAMHLDKLLSWDDMRDAGSSQDGAKGTRISESQFFTQEKHDLLSRVQIMELNENGDYQPVEVTQTSELDTGTFQLHQGLQRRIVISLSHSSGEALPWGEVTAVRVGKIRLVDSAGKTPDMGANEPDIALKLSSTPVFRENANGTRSIAIFAQWDSSLHNSLLLDRVTAEKYRVQMTITWEIGSDKLAEPMRFAQKACLQILSRTFVRQTSVFSSLFQNVRLVRSSTGIFTLTMRPAPIKRVGDLWRMSSRHDYVKGQENLTSWAPRGVSLVSDFILARKKRRRMAEIGEMQAWLNKPDGFGARLDARSGEAEPEPPPQARPVVPDEDDKPEQQQQKPQQEEETTIKVEEQASSGAEAHGYSEREAELLRRCLSLWTKYPDPLASILSPANTAPPRDGLAPDSAPAPGLVATIVRVPKNPRVLKGGYLLVPNGDSTRWVKRFVELRRPYLHIHSATDGDEVGLVSLRNSRVDSQPGVLGILHGPAAGDVDVAAVHRGAPPGLAAARRRRAAASPGLGRLTERLQAAVFAVYGTDNTWLFTARSERDKMDWILRIDQTYLSNGEGAPDSGLVTPYSESQC